MSFATSIAGPLAAPALKVRQSARRAARPAAAGSRLRVFAAASDEDEERKLTFGASGNASKGYMDGDSAGQSNIFAVEPKVYTQGSAQDTQSSSVGLYNIAAAFGGAAILAGAFIVLSQESGSATAVAFDGAKTLSYYVNAFK